MAKYRKMMTRSLSQISAKLMSRAMTVAAAQRTTKGRNEANCIWILGFR
ncbi:MAG: hypothetical protein WAM88_11745 [Nitrososphaeraceae archaeon]